MKTFLKYTSIFSLGLAVGAGIMKIYFDSNYRVVDEEIEPEEEIKEDSEETDKCEEKKSQGEKFTKTIEKMENNKKAITEYHKLCDSYGPGSDKTITPVYPDSEDETYDDDTSDLEEVNYDDEPIIELEKRERIINNDLPYVIDEEEFLSLDDYDSGEYTYYPDGYVTDGSGIPINRNDVVNMIGYEFVNEFEDKDEVFVRNERLKMDFSIVKDLDNFEDVANNNPRLWRYLSDDIKLN